jgi:hypothetical protein
VRLLKYSLFNDEEDDFEEYKPMTKDLKEEEHKTSKKPVQVIQEPTIE